VEKNAVGVFVVRHVRVHKAPTVFFSISASSTGFRVSNRYVASKGKQFEILAP
jgi:hypothetical protein